MSGSRSGLITVWNDATGDGLIDGLHVVSAEDCSNQLVKELRGKAIPPDQEVPVTFDLNGTNDATSVDLAEPIDLAASEEESA
jgi:hypothetical protein